MGIDYKQLIIVAAFATAGVVTGCESITGLDEFRLDSTGTGALECLDPTAFGGRGCFSCEPEDGNELHNSCTTAKCVPFDNTRIPGGLSRDLTPAPAPMATAPTVPTTTIPVPPVQHVKCADLQPRPVYLYGSTALNLGLRTLAQAIADRATLVVQNDTSCLGLDAILTGITRLKGTAQYWMGGTEAQCDIDGEQVADIGLCDLSPESCVPNFTGDANLVDDIGPAQVFMFTVPNGSSQVSISAEAAYAVFGYDDAGVMPWIDPQSIVRRGPTSGTLLTLAASLGLPHQYWRGIIKQRSSEMKPTLLAMPDPDKALGITSADVADEQDSRANLRTLAYQHFNQNCSFTPDSTLGSSDKRNVRDGHYELWSPFHFYTRGLNGRTSDAFVAEIVSYLKGARALPNGNTDFITTLKQAGLVPLCAMKVTRSREGAQIAPFQPPNSCSCYYESSPPGGSEPASCKSCNTNADCGEGTPNCNFGYCEP
ncbi:MAG: hypothetical protein RL033_4293 [Pseudomonadota bacterium]|jgi:hypothetical protein